MAKIPRTFTDFAKTRQGVEAVLQRLGAGVWDLVLIDAKGNWTRAVLRSEDEAKAACAELGVPIHDGWDDPALARKVDSLDAWGTLGAQRRAL